MISKKLNIIFETNFRETHNMVFDYGTTIDITLKQFLKKIGRPDLINGDSNQISFLFNTTKLEFGDTTKIEKFFHKIQCAKIFVNIKDIKYDSLYRSYQYNSNNNQNILIKEPTIQNNDNSYLFIENNELKRRLKKEKEKNQKLIYENYNLMKKIESLNDKIDKMKESKIKVIDYLDTNSIKSLNTQEKILAVNFVSMGVSDIGHYNIICKNVDLFVKLEFQLYKDFPKFKDYDTFFMVNGKKIKRFKTMDENNIKNNDVISIFINEN